jgi:transposase InsO family protein
LGSERTVERKLALEAIHMALAQRQPAQGLLHHSDRGRQYASTEYQQLLAQYGIRSSMSRKGNCWDNAVAESFFATLNSRFTKVSGTTELRLAVKSSNTSSAFTIANDGTRLSVTCVPLNSNDAIMNQWPPNPSVHAFGATKIAACVRSVGYNPNSWLDSGGACMDPAPCARLPQKS